MKKKPSPTRAKVNAAVSTAAAADQRSYPRQVVDELRKVIWPNGQELYRMTGIVVVTVLIFAAIIGIADYGLAAGVGKIYNTSATPTPAAAASTNPAATPVPAPVQPIAP